MPSVTIFLPWPTLSVAPLPPTLVLTPVLLRLTFTPGRTPMLLRKRKYPMVLRLSSIDPGECSLETFGLSTLPNHTLPLRGVLDGVYEASRQGVLSLKSLVRGYP